MDYRSRNIPANCSFPARYSFKNIPEDLDIITTSASNLYHFLEEIKKHFSKICAQYRVCSNNLYSLEIAEKEIHQQAVVFYQAHYETPEWNFRLDILCQPQNNHIPPLLITDRNDFINNSCYLYGSNNHIQASFPTAVSKYYSSQNQRLEFVRYLHNHLYLLPYCQEDWFNIPKVSFVSTTQPRLIRLHFPTTIDKIWEATNLWKRSRKYYERGYRFYPKSIPGYYDSKKFRCPHYRKTSNPSPICIVCKKACSYFAFHLDSYCPESQPNPHKPPYSQSHSSDNSYVFHIGCLVNVIKQQIQSSV